MTCNLCPEAVGTKLVKRLDLLQCLEMRNFFLALVLFLCACNTGRLAETTSFPEAATVDNTKLTPSQVYMNQWRIIQHMAIEYPTVGVKVQWIPCGEENSYYDPETKTISLCTEMSAHSGAAVFFAAHEMGHAITHQLTYTVNEIDADEIGALAMIKYDFSQELLDAALYHLNQDIQGHIYWDPHPSNGFRAWYLTCLESGSENDFGLSGPVECKWLYRATRMKWDMRLHDKKAELLDALFPR